MSTQTDIIDRNRTFTATFEYGDMPALPRLGTMILTCFDARADPAYVLGLDRGEAVVSRNISGRVTQSFIDGVSALAIMVAKMTSVEDASFGTILMQHTNWGAQSFADPGFSAAINASIGVDVSETAITDQTKDQHKDIEKLRQAPNLAGSIRVSALLYDVETGSVSEIAPPAKLAELRD